MDDKENKRGLVCLNDVSCTFVGQFLLETGETGSDLIQGHLIIQGAKAEALAGVAVAVAVAGRASITPGDCPIQDLYFSVTIWPSRSWDST